MLKEQLRKTGLDAGLAAVGFASAPDEVREAFPWAASVVVTAVCCLPPEKAGVAAGARGRVARFAQSADYHAVLRSRLGCLSEAVSEAFPGARVEVCVDTAPIPERKLAVLAGIASRGRGGSVFVRGCGSYAALGEILTDALIPADAAGDCGFDACGDCNRCISACPTGAITPSGVVNASTCVSALTQMSGIIPVEHRRAIGDRIYGCDNCQEVCPRNASAGPGAPDFAADVFPGPSPDLLALIDLTPAGFRQTVKQSSIGWLRRTRIRRNAAVAAGNTRCAQAVPSLVSMLSDPDPVLRAHAAWALGQISSLQAIHALDQARHNECDPLVVKEIEDALENK